MHGPVRISIFLTLTDVSYVCVPAKRYHRLFPQQVTSSFEARTNEQDLHSLQMP